MEVLNATSTHLTDTAELVEKHVKDKSTTGISNSISSWVKTLSQHKELKGIADDLESLKEAISAKDGKKIVMLMSKVGSETTKASESADGSEAKKIKALGAALSAGAKAIEKFAK